MPLNFFYTTVQKSQKWPKTQIKGGGPALIRNPRSLLSLIAGKVTLRSLSHTNTHSISFSLFLSLIFSSISLSLLFLFLHCSAFACVFSIPRRHYAVQHNTSHHGNPTLLQGACKPPTRNASVASFNLPEEKAFENKELWLVTLSDFFLPSFAFFFSFQDQSCLGQLCMLHGKAVFHSFSVNFCVHKKLHLKFSLNTIVVSLSGDATSDIVCHPSDAFAVCCA